MGPQYRLWDRFQQYSLPSLVRYITTLGDILSLAVQKKPPRLFFPFFFSGIISQIQTILDEPFDDERIWSPLMLYVLYVWPFLDCCILTRSNFHSLSFVSSPYPSSDGAPKNADKLLLFLAFSPSLPPSPCSVAFKDIPPNRFSFGEQGDALCLRGDLSKGILP